MENVEKKRAEIFNFPLNSLALNYIINNTHLSEDMKIWDEDLGFTKFIAKTTTTN